MDLNRRFIVLGLLLFILSSVLISYYYIYHPKVENNDLSVVNEFSDLSQEPVSFACNEDIHKSVVNLVQQEEVGIDKYVIESCRHLGDGVFHVTVRSIYSQLLHPYSLRYDKSTGDAEWLNRGNGSEASSISPGGRFLLVYARERNKVEVYDVWKNTKGYIQADEGYFQFGESWYQALASWVGPGEFVIGVLPIQTADKLITQSNVAEFVDDWMYVNLYDDDLHWSNNF